MMKRTTPRNDRLARNAERGPVARRRASGTPAEPDIRSRIVKVADVKTHGTTVLYGRSGSGKTTLACTWPGPILLVDVKDRGTKSVEDVKDLEVFPAEEWQDIEDVYWFIKKNPDEFATVIIDTVTQMQHFAILKVLADKKKDVNKAGDWGTMSKREWGDVAQMMKSWIDHFRSLPCDVVFIAQDRIFNFDEDAGTADDEQLAPEVGPRLSPSVVSHLNAAANVIGNTYIRRRLITKEVKGKKQEVERLDYCLRIGPNSIYVTKMRKPRSVVLPPLLVDPTYEDIQDLIKGE